MFKMATTQKSRKGYKVIIMSFSNSGVDKIDKEVCEVDTKNKAIELAGIENEKLLHQLYDGRYL